mmetsp:Transcript_21792/g.43768  ORF Transcript_21792/g.43768 Transcript_21792/m.43768 type:complete len:308 (-) Transcript_21792:256-1179(-)
MLLREACTRRALSCVAFFSARVVATGELFVAHRPATKAMLAVLIKRPSAALPLGVADFAAETRLHLRLLALSARAHVARLCASVLEALQGLVTDVLAHPLLRPVFAAAQAESRLPASALDRLAHDLAGRARAGVAREVAGVWAPEATGSAADLVASVGSEEGLRRGVGRLPAEAPHCAGDPRDPELASWTPPAEGILVDVEWVAVISLGNQRLGPITHALEMQDNVAARAAPNRLALSHNFRAHSTRVRVSFQAAGDVPGHVRFRDFLFILLLQKLLVTPPFLLSLSLVRLRILTAIRGCFFLVRKR